MSILLNSSYILSCCLTCRSTYAQTDPISFVSAPNPLQICVIKYPHSNPQPVNIRSAPNPTRKYGIGYGKGKIRSDPFTPLVSILQENRG